MKIIPPLVSFPPLIIIAYLIILVMFFAVLGYRVKQRIQYASKPDHKVTCKTCAGIFYTKDIKVTECYGCEVLNKGF